MSHFAPLKKALKNQQWTKAEIAKIEEAYLLAEKAHSPQKRQSGEPYIIHPVAVATSLAELHMDAETIMAALLHDVIEDTSVDKSVIVEKFGQAVADLVDGVSKLTQMPFRNKAELQVESFRKMILAMSKDLRVILVKLADRLHNMQTLDVVSPEKRRRVAKETLEIYTPLAKRLGMHKLRTQLEDLCFAALHPQREQIIKDRLKKIRGNRKEIVSVISTAIERACKAHRLTYLQVEGREKHIYSIYKKMRDRALSFAEITDVYGFRIIVDNIEDCYRVLGYVHNLYKPVPERFKDYIAIPKANGYKSLHTTLFGPYGVPIEIQIRTRLMHEMAENGIAAHWLYKSNDPDQNTDAQIRAQAWVQNLMEIQNKSGNSTEFIENFKIDLFPDEVYVFTPTGNILELPKGSTPIDFAYAVHSDVGNTCVAAKVDRQYTILSRPLVNGQTVEIICDENAAPSALWLDFVVTSRAQSAIRHYLKHELNNDAFHLGETLLTKALAKFSLSLASLPEGLMEGILKESHLSSKEQLFEKIGLGNLVAQLVAERLATGLKGDSTPVNVIEAEESPYVQGTEGFKVNFSHCCYPIPGDVIIGELQLNKGILVHHESCSKIVASKSQDYVPLRWQENVNGDFAAEMAIAVENTPGMINKLTTAVTLMNTNIEDFYVYKLNESERVLVLVVMVHNREHLDKIIRNVEKVEHVLRVSRGKLS